jgi:hypothetical protein
MTFAGVFLSSARFRCQLVFFSRSGEHLGAALHGIGEKLFFFIIDVTQWRDALTASQSYVGSAARVSESCEHKGWMGTRIMRMIKDEKHTKGNKTRKKRGIRRTLKRNVTINAKCEEIMFLFCLPDLSPTTWS